ncbi:hypothetical protein [Amphibiibacter pelophylacis]|uniref:Uncharacterized protein n=1 Tax=Amphibiibacter pelophylacis TaxID=1799477 RepID=A0ACC6P022_9BURK
MPYLPRTATPLALCAALLLAAAPAAQACSGHTVSDAVAEFVKSKGASKVPPFRTARVDLNRDGRPDAVVLLGGRDWCGSGGCTLLVFRGSAHEFHLVGDTSVADTPVRLAKTRSKGWSSLIVHSKGSGEVLLNFDGRSYPDNASVQPKAGSAALKQSRTLLR